MSGASQHSIAGESGQSHLSGFRLVSSPTLISSVWPPISSSPGSWVSWGFYLLVVGPPLSPQAPSSLVWLWQPPIIYSISTSYTVERIAQCVCGNTDSRQVICLDWQCKGNLWQLQDILSNNMPVCGVYLGNHRLLAMVTCPAMLRCRVVIRRKVSTWTNVYDVIAFKVM